MYGAFFESQSGYRVFMAGYKCLNFVGGGYTGHIQRLLYGVRFNCPSFPIIYLRSTINGNVTTIHSVVHNGGNNYTLYTLGEAEVFVFTEVISRSDYGLEIYDDKGNITFNSATCTPVRPVASVTFPPMAPGQSISWNSGLGARKLAYNLLGNRGYMRINLANGDLYIWRDVVKSVSGGFVLMSMQLPNSAKASEIDIFTSQLAGFINYANQTPTQPMLMSVIDVHDLDFAGRRSSSYY